jgi:fluoride ion exporter CrcB/FEX
MDFHPLVIHYPIAFLTTYAVFELLRFKKFLDWSHWFYIKATLLLVGELGAVATVSTFFIDNTTLAGESSLVDMYKLFIIITTFIFGLITIGYLKWSRILRPAILVPLTLIGLFFIVVSGGLFGATIYGTQFDLFLAPIFKLLGVY